MKNKKKKEKKKDGLSYFDRFNESYLSFYSLALEYMWINRTGVFDNKGMNIIICIKKPERFQVLGKMSM